MAGHVGTIARRGCARRAEPSTWLGRAGPLAGFCPRRVGGQRPGGSAHRAVTISPGTGARQDA